MTDRKAENRAGSIERVLIANRGEIALRVARACRELGIASIAIYGDGEEHAAHVRYADDAWRITSTSGLPYLDIDAIVSIARRAGAGAVHPGYGFLAENAAFARAVQEAGLIFIGPSPEAIAAMGDKVRARQIAVAAGVSPVPGTTDPVPGVAAARAWAKENAYPVAVKAAGGGGGRGFRVARNEGEMAAAFEGSRGEAERYFANPSVYLERYLERPRHVEVQIFADTQGHVVAMGERDCSIQRRHQKLIEETPSPAVTPEIRAAIFAASEKLARAVDYIGAGTIEYLLDADGSFYFLEMNTRIQVEHTVTEMVTGIDLVKEQIRVAEGQPLSFAAPVPTGGWAIECRINAEDAARNFGPAPGRIIAYEEPKGFGVRVDGSLSAGGEIHPGYDSLIAKLVCWGRDRDEAIDRMLRALGDFRIEGVPTTIPFDLRALANPVFRAGDATTTFIEEHPDVLPAPAPPAVTMNPDGEAAPAPASLLVEVGGHRFDVSVIGAPAPASARTEGAGRAKPRRRASAGTAVVTGAEKDLLSPIQGTVVRVAASDGQTVSRGALICVVEAMKMENEVTAHRDGTVRDLAVAVGEGIKVGSRIATID